MFYEYLKLQLHKKVSSTKPINHLEYQQLQKTPHI